MMGREERVFAPLTQMSLEELVPQGHFYLFLERKLDLSFAESLCRRPMQEEDVPPLNPLYSSSCNW